MLQESFTPPHASPIPGSIILIIGMCCFDLVRSKLLQCYEKTINQFNESRILAASLSPFAFDKIDFTQKFQKFITICGTICRILKSKVRRKIMLKFYISIAVPTSLYVRKTWVLTSKDRISSQAGEMRFFRSLIGFKEGIGSVMTTFGERRKFKT